MQPATLRFKTRYRQLETSIHGRFSPPAWQKHYMCLRAASTHGRQGLGNREPVCKYTVITLSTLSDCLSLHLPHTSLGYRRAVTPQDLVKRVNLCTARNAYNRHSNLLRVGRYFHQQGSA
jgi:hypothetical protein